jgi:hypothetical protein
VREEALYRDPQLREMMPATREIIGNQDRSIRMPDGYVFPPSIVIEKGESLDVWAQREKGDFATAFQVRVGPHLSILPRRSRCEQVRIRPGFLSLAKTLSLQFWRGWPQDEAVNVVGSLVQLTGAAWICSPCSAHVNPSWFKLTGSTFNRCNVWCAGIVPLG